MSKPKFCVGEIVDFLGVRDYPPQCSVEILEAVFYRAGDTVTQDGELRRFASDTWGYRHDWSLGLSTEKCYKKRPDKREPFSIEALKEEYKVREEA